MPAILTVDSFSVSHSFHLLVLFSSKPLIYFLFWIADIYPLFFQSLLPFRLSFLAVLFAVIFPKWAESIPTRLKVFPATSLYSSSFWVPRGTSLLFMNCHSPSFLILCCTIGCLRGTYLFFISCILWYSFWAVSIPLCCTSRGSRASGDPGPVLSLDFVGLFNGLFYWKSEHT